MGEVLKSMGYNVDYVQADYIAQFAGLEIGRPRRRHGDVGDHRQGRHGSRADATGKTVDLGETGM